MLLIIKNIVQSLVTRTFLWGLFILYRRLRWSISRPRHPTVTQSLHHWTYMYNLVFLQLCSILMFKNGEKKLLLKCCRLARFGLFGFRRLSVVVYYIQFCCAWTIAFRLNWKKVFYFPSNSKIEPTCPLSRNYFSLSHKHPLERGQSNPKWFILSGSCYEISPCYHGNRDDSLNAYILGEFLGYVLSAKLFAVIAFVGSSWCLQLYSHRGYREV